MLALTLCNQPHDHGSEGETGLRDAGGGLFLDLDNDHWCIQLVRIHQVIPS